MTDQERLAGRWIHRIPSIFPSVFSVMPAFSIQVSISFLLLPHSAPPIPLPSLNSIPSYLPPSRLMILHPPSTPLPSIPPLKRMQKHNPFKINEDYYDSLDPPIPRGSETGAIPKKEWQFGSVTGTYYGMHHSGFTRARSVHLNSCH